MWCNVIVTFANLLICISCQIIPDEIDYANFPLPFNIIPGQLNLQNRQSAFTFGTCKVVYNQVCPDPDVTFYLYTQTHPEVPENITVGTDVFESNLNSSAFDPSKPSKIIIHGYNSDMYLNVLVEIRKEYLKTNNYNIFAVDWSPLNPAPCYLGALINMRLVGNCTSFLIQRLREHGATDIHLIGFSLGAHVTNYASVALRPFKLSRITGLDPALPGFLTPNKDDKLDKTDAEFVDVYHTNAFMQGQFEESGHVDVYMNGGVIQPGCWAERRFFACNHHRAPLYFAESINTKKGFWGWPCPSYLDYLLGRCPPQEPQIIMGDHVNRTANGVYLTITESVSPFAVGKFEGPSIEVLLYRSELNRRTILDKYREEVMDFIDEDDFIENSYYIQKLERRYETYFTSKTKHVSNADNIIED